MDIKIKTKGDLTIISYTEDCTEVETMTGENVIRFGGYEKCFGKKPVTKKITEYVFNGIFLLYKTVKYD